MSLYLILASRLLHSTLPNHPLIPNRNLPKQILRAPFTTQPLILGHANPSCYLYLSLSFIYPSQSVSIPVNTSRSLSAPLGFSLHFLLYLSVFLSFCASPSQPPDPLPLSWFPFFPSLPVNLVYLPNLLSFTKWLYMLLPSYLVFMFCSVFLEFFRIVLVLSLSLSKFLLSPTFCETLRSVGFARFCYASPFSEKLNETTVSNKKVSPMFFGHDSAST